jgi:acetyl-CoA carboxylase biotin carboxylase subunit
MDRLGNKDKAKVVARAAKVPTVPGSDGLITSDQDAARFAEKVGYPVLIKAAAGGGGKGMRVARDPAALIPGLSAARAEAEASFKDGSVYLEKYLDRPRHVEVQLLGDRHGNVLHLFERDCSLQRRHQKLVEESPAPTLPIKVRTKLSEAAVRLAKAVGYVNAGTCEFLVDSENNFYFIEVNARIQVEHPVSEMITGVDLVQLQLKIAGGEPPSIQQHDIAPRGHAIEARIIAENPDRGFAPSPGRIRVWRPPHGEGIRLDTAMEEGAVVPPFYDSMIAKLIVHAHDRSAAVERLRAALESFVVEGISTNIPFLRAIAAHPDFVDNRVDTRWLENVLLPQYGQPKDP